MLPEEVTLRERAVCCRKHIGKDTEIKNDRIVVWAVDEIDRLRAELEVLNNLSMERSERE